MPQTQAHKPQPKSSGRRI